MEQKNKDFDVPFYIFEEILDYVELTAKNQCKTAKWNNIKALLRLATVNGRITKEQANFLENTYCRE